MSWKKRTCQTKINCWFVKATVFLSHLLSMFLAILFQPVLLSNINTQYDSNEFVLFYLIELSKNKDEHLAQL